MTAVVLVVDDDPVILKLLTVNFEMDGYVVLSAVDGAEALEVVRAQRPDIAVSDIMMPVMSGLDLVAAMRADDDLAAIPAILLSAKAQATDVKAGLAAGATDYVTKPFDPLDLISRAEPRWAADPTPPPRRHPERRTSRKAASHDSRRSLLRRARRARRSWRRPAAGPGPARTPGPT